MLDITFSFLGLLILSPVLTIVSFLIWKQDRHSPFYIATRVGLNGKLFQMVKLRSMIIGADKSGVDSTASNDSRITPIGNFVRKYKLDEFTQLWNVLKGEMSLVGPRPNVKRETDLYTHIEKGLLTVKPGITDFASIVFSDEGEILEDKDDPDLSYNQLIRPWKSRLGLVYINNQSILLDIMIIYYTIIALISKRNALDWVVAQLKKMNADIDLVIISQRKKDLFPFPPPGADKIVVSRKPLIK